MKVGLSLSKCIADIISGAVKQEDILIIITRTDFDPHNDDHWENIWGGYTRGNGFASSPWSNFSDRKEEVRELVQLLHDQGKLHQPRQYGAHPRSSNHAWLDVILPEEDLHNKPAVKKAWENYQLIAGLS